MTSLVRKPADWVLGIIRTPADFASWLDDQIDASDLSGRQLERLAGAGEGSTSNIRTRNGNCALRTLLKLVNVLGYEVRLVKRPPPGIL